MSLLLWACVVLTAATLAALFTAFPRNALAKARLYAGSLPYFFLSKEWPRMRTGPHAANAFPPRVSVASGPGAPAARVVIRVYFVRHGESVWNACVNRFGLFWPFRVARALLAEAALFFTDPLDSQVVDTPLSARGRQQAKDLAAFLRQNPSAVAADPASSVVVASNLRRAMETAVIGLGPRLAATRERVAVHSALQEASRNADALSVSTRRGLVAPIPFAGVPPASAAPDGAGPSGSARSVLLSKVFDARLNGGNKELKSNVWLRHDAFVQSLLLGAEGASEGPALVPANAAADGGQPPSTPRPRLQSAVVVGHSMWFKKFFARFLPAGSAHVAGQQKMENCAVVAFDLVWDRTSGGVVSIDEASIKPVYKGFGKK